MSALQRRRLLALLGSTAAVAAAGCIDDSSLPTDGNGDGSDSDDKGVLRDGAVVDYPGMVDGDASVSGDEEKITYEDPEATFTFQYAYEGDTDDPSQLRVSRDLSGETMAAFIAPVYDAEAEAFAYHAFANEAFLEYADWYYVSGRSNDPTETGRASFEPVGNGVSRFVIGPIDVGTAGLIDAPPEEAQSGGGELTGVILTNGSSGGTPSPAPNVSWGFDYDSAAEEVTITHEGGDTVRGAQLEVVVTTDDRTTTSPFEGEVAAGDSVAVDAPPNAVVRIIWEAESGDSGAVLARWEGPEA
ncbi:hypothetical protein GJ631_10960 [Natronomonas sp. CBA1123]|uniref:type IV pilin n=1 Tax=Natronomonas sp. CBA1123 TaxID=2668070 RepID=UPI0012E99673|nr:type IV pilin [Natronomonas sp. CBA1123]MUV87074.1 hypothetical protein [Natronomonas sp. CBA1123]